MPDYFSYIDTALRIIYINRETDLTEIQKKKLNESIDQVETSAHIRQHFIRQYITNQLQSDSTLNDLLLHEFHHYLQGLFYPFLFYINWLEFDNLIYVRNLIRSSEDESFKIADLGLAGEFRNNFLYTSQKFQLYWNANRLWVKSPEEDAPSRDIFSLNDLLEDSTTIFQYKLLNPNPNADSFYEFVLNPSNKCYRRLYRFLVKKLGKQFTYDLLPLFVQIAFTTTEPIGAFCNTISYAFHNFQDYELFETDVLFTILLEKLEKEFGSYEIDPLNDIDINRLPNKVLKHTGIKNLIDFAYEQVEFFHYPFSLHAKKFSTILQRDGFLLFDLIKIDKDKFKFLLKTFEPMVTHYYFREMNGRNGAFFIGKDFEEEPGPFGVDYAFYIKELIKVKEIVQGLLTNVQEIVPNHCHHSNCDYHVLGLCAKYNSIPEDYTFCGFPDLFTVIFHRKINLKKSTLDKITKEEADTRWDLYISKSHKKRNFNFVKLNNSYILTIGSDDFIQSEKKNMFSDFIEYLIHRQQETRSKLCGRIMLDFYGFDNDSREVNAIPEIQNWMRETIIQVPEFLCYINFNSDVDHLKIILPALIKHQYKVDKENNSWYLFNKDEKMIFIQQQTFAFAKFYNENPDVDQNLLLNTINKIYGN